MTYPPISFGPSASGKDLPIFCDLVLSSSSPRNLPKSSQTYKVSQSSKLAHNPVTLLVCLWSSASCCSYLDIFLPSCTGFISNLSIWATPQSSLCSLCLVHNRGEWMLNEGILNKSKKVTLLLSPEYCTLALNTIVINIISIKVK